MAREAKQAKQPSTPRNKNLGNFVDVVTPEPKVITENYLQLDEVVKNLKGADQNKKELIESLIDIALSVNKKEEYLTMGEQIAINTLRKLQILV